MSSTTDTAIFILLPAAKMDHLSDMIAQKEAKQPITKLVTF
jgi:hypothetical protein